MQRSSGEGAGWRTRLAKHVAMLAALGVLTACQTTEEPGPRFANDPVATRDQPPLLPTLDTASPPAVPPVLGTPIRRGPAQLLRARGAPQHIYFNTDRALWVLDTESDSAEELWGADDGTLIRSVAASPAGDYAAILIERPDDEAGSEIVLLDASGAEIRRVDNLAAPLGTDGVTARAIDWSPQGDQLLIAFDPGGIVALPTGGDGETRIVVGVDQSPAPREATWSPSGEMVAYVAAGADGETEEIFIAGATASPTPPEAVADPVGAGQAVRGLAWAPNGRSVFFVEGGVSGGDLWRIAPDGSNRALVASAGSAVPVGRVGIFEPSPAGDAVAYTVEIPAASGATFHSLWVRQTVAAPGSGVQLDVPEGEAVIAIWWSQQGPIFATTPILPADQNDQDRPVTLYRAVADGAPERVLSIGPQSGTPVANASPVPTDLAGSPVAPEIDAVPDA